MNQMDEGGNFALKYALTRGERNELHDLMKRGANVNQIDTKGRNLLHHAINMSSDSADATFEVE